MEHDTNMEVARMDGGECLVEVTPELLGTAEGRTQIANAGIAVARKMLAELRVRFDALGGGDLGKSQPGETKNLRYAMEAASKKMLALEGMMTDWERKHSPFDAYLTQVHGTGTKIDPLAVRGRLAEMIAALKEREKAFSPRPPRHTYIYAVTATDAEHTALQRAMRKADERFGVCIPQNDTQWKAAERLFKSR